jgi:hypothetical protein
MVLLAAVTALSVAASSGGAIPECKSEACVEFDVAKWLDGRPAAVSITLDDALSPELTKEILARKVRVSFELVTSSVSDLDAATLRERLPTHGGLVSYYGHGYEHSNHDALRPTEAEASFRMSRELMSGWGLDTRGCAYPYGAGVRPETQVAAARAGYLFARGVEYRDVKVQPLLIAPDGVDAPWNWYYLPGVLVSRADEKGAAMFRGEHVRSLVEQAVSTRAWVILVYHSVGSEGGWGYYPLADFRKDLGFVTSKGAWIDHMEDVACYLRERRRVAIAARDVSVGGPAATFTVSAEDGIDSSVCNQELTVTARIRSARRYSACSIERGSGSQRRRVKDNALTMNVVPDGGMYRVACR